MKMVKKKKSMFVRDKVRGGMNRWSIKDFKGSEKYSLYDTIMMDTSHYICVQTHRICNGKSECNIS